MPRLNSINVPLTHISDSLLLIDDLPLLGQRKLRDVAQDKIGHFAVFLFAQVLNKALMNYYTPLIQFRNGPGKEGLVPFERQSGRFQRSRNQIARGLRVRFNAMQIYVSKQSSPSCSFCLTRSEPPTKPTTTYRRSKCELLVLIQF